jgi:ribonucleotide reductase beta subunit family protein with ferritin-like domain
MVLLESRENFRPFEYEEAFNFAKAQNDHHWTHSQIEVESDLMQYNTEFTDAERHGINTVLKLFTTYEIHVADYWIDVVYRWFPKPEVRQMAQVFAAMEAEHALFYDKLNTALGLGTKEFYLEFTKDPVMTQRMEFIDKMIAKGDGSFSKGETFEGNLATSLAAFSFIEGVVLYSSFAFLMSFQQPPKNKLKNVFTGLSYSVRDEALHADADSWLFRTFLKENEDKIDKSKLMDEIIQIAIASYEVEEKIIEQIFAEGKIEGITEHQLKEFVKSRINKKVKDLGYGQIYDVSYNPISKWFYKSINTVEFGDFFDRSSTSYTNNWNFSKIGSW